ITVSCSPMGIVVYNSTRCTVAVTDTYPAPAVTPIGTITLSSNGTGTFTLCSLSGSGATVTCSTTYRPTVVGTGFHLLTFHYAGDTRHSAALPDSTSLVTVSPRVAAIAVSCAWPVPIGSATNCTVTATDTSPGTFFTPTGTVALSGTTGNFTG